MRITNPQRRLAESYGVQKWMRAKKFPWDDYFTDIDLLLPRAQHRTMRRQADEDFDDPEAPEQVNWAPIVQWLAWGLDEEGALEAYAKKQRTIGPDPEWMQVCEVTAMMIVNRYQKERANGGESDSG